SIVQGFQGDKVDAIVAIATPTAQAAASAAKEIPVVFSAVTDPVAAGLVTDLNKPDKNITGTSDAVQVEMILDFALKMNPQMKTLGVIYNIAEANSESNIARAKAFAEKNGLQFEEAVATNSSEVQQAAQVLCEKSDAIFAPNDNTIAPAMNVLAAAAKKAKVPVYVGADSMVADGGFATIGINYVDLGKETANMVDAILKGKTPAEIPVKVFDDNLSTYINTTTAAEIGMTISDEILNSKTTVTMK
ncbi:MAG: ABC transporter substrate-binding protein, partial [Oscillospiraceae bacterium]